MKLLLDTHTFVWAVGQPTKLSKAALRELRAPDNELVVSAATAWEIATKHRLGRFPEAEPLITGFERVVKDLGASVLTIDAPHALFAGAMAWDHRDPFDRMLASQALRENLTFVTRDAAFGALRGLKLLW